MREQLCVDFLLCIFAVRHFIVLHFVCMLIASDKWLNNSSKGWGNFLKVKWGCLNKYIHFICRLCEQEDVLRAYALSWSFIYFDERLISAFSCPEPGLRRGDSVYLVGLSRSLQATSRKSVVTNPCAALNIGSADSPRYRATNMEVIELDTGKLFFFFNHHVTHTNKCLTLHVFEYRFW